MDLFNSAAIGILELDTKGFFLQINNQGAKLLGHSSPQMLLDDEIKISELNLAKEEWEKFIEAVDQQGAINNYTITFSRGKEKKYLEFSLASVKDTKRNITGYRGTFGDITDRIQLEEERLNKAKTESLKNRY